MISFCSGKISFMMCFCKDLGYECEKIITNIVTNQ